MRGLVDRLSARLSARSEAGQGMVEYALIIVFVALAVIAALMILGPSVANIYNRVGNSLT